MSEPRLTKKLLHRIYYAFNRWRYGESYGCGLHLANAMTASAHEPPPASKDKLANELYGAIKYTPGKIISIHRELANRILTALRAENEPCAMLTPQEQHAIHNVLNFCKLNPSMASTIDVTARTLLKGLLDRAAQPPPADHVCGPWSQCDSSCVEGASPPPPAELWGDGTREMLIQLRDWLKAKMPCPAGDCCNELRDWIGKVDQHICFHAPAADPPPADEALSLLKCVYREVSDFAGVSEETMQAIELHLQSTLTKPADEVKV